METDRIKKTMAILLVVVFLVTVTAGAVSAMKINSPLEVKKPNSGSTLEFKSTDNAIEKFSTQLYSNGNSIIKRLNPQPEPP
jgi:hypothetical protein